MMQQQPSNLPGFQLTSFFLPHVTSTVSWGDSQEPLLFIWSLRSPTSFDMLASPSQEKRKIETRDGAPPYCKGPEHAQ